MFHFTYSAENLLLLKFVHKLLFSVKGNGYSFKEAEISPFPKINHFSKKPASVAQLNALSDWRPGGHGFNPRRGQQHSFLETDREIFSTVILSLPLIQEGQLSVSGERMCTILVNRLED